MSEWFDRDGKPLEMLEWARLFENLEYKRVARDELTNGCLVSTVWLGLNHGYGGPPLIFETMVFRPDDGVDGGDMERYSTEAEARAGHDAMVKKWSTHQ